MIALLDLSPSVSLNPKKVLGSVNAKASASDMEVRDAYRQKISYLKIVRQKKKKKKKEKKNVCFRFPDPT